MTPGLGTVDLIVSRLTIDLPGVAPEIRSPSASAALHAPTVRELIAEELYAAADALERQAEHPDEGPDAGLVDAASQLRDRADTLTDRS
jgi:hypothetical protein